MCTFMWLYTNTTDKKCIMVYNNALCCIYMLQSHDFSFFTLFLQCEQKSVIIHKHTVIGRPRYKSISSCAFFLAYLWFPHLFYLINFESTNYTTLEKCWPIDLNKQYQVFYTEPKLYVFDLSSFLLFLLFCFVFVLAAMQKKTMTHFPVGFFEPQQLTINIH